MIFALIFVLGTIHAAPIQAWEAAKISFNQQRIPNPQKAQELWDHACAQKHKPSCRFRSTDKESWVEQECAQGDPLACTVQAWMHTQFPLSSGSINPNSPTFAQADPIVIKACNKDPNACLHVLSSENRTKISQTVQKNCDQGHAASCVYLAQDMLDVDPTAPKAYNILSQHCNQNTPEACTYLAGIHINKRQYDPAKQFLEQSCDALHTIGCQLLGHQKLRSSKPETAFVHFADACTGNDLPSCLFMTQLYTQAPKKQLPFLQKSCRLQDAQSCAIVGKGLKQSSPSTSYRYLEKACTLSHTESCFSLGFALEKTNPTTSMTMYEQGCLLGHAPSCVNGGALAFTMKNKKASISLYQAGCQLGDPKACSTLGLLYLRGEAGEMNIPIAHRLLTIGCAARITNSCDALFHELPQYATTRCQQGVAKNCYLAAQSQEKTKPDVARELAQKGCDDQDTLSCVKLGYYWLSGIGGTVDKGFAKELFTKGCTENAGSGCFNLGLLRLEEEQSKIAALQYFQQACTLKDVRGCVQGGKILQTDQRIQSQDLFAQGCTLLDGGSCTILGNMLLSTSPKKARTYYEKGCMLGYAEACQNFAVCTHKGIGGTKDPTMTQELMDRACRLGRTQACAMKK